MASFSEPILPPNDVTHSNGVSGYVRSLTCPEKYPKTILIIEPSGLLHFFIIYSLANRYGRQTFFLI